MNNNLRPCFDCNGFFVKIQKPKSYDFNKDGWIPLYCNDCGLCSDSNRIARAHTYSNELSHVFIEHILEIICKKILKNDYTFKAALLKLLKENSFFDVYDLAEEITLHCHGRGYPITINYILNTIYSELNYSAFTFSNT